jgi:ankyrin repeat protein
VTDFIEAALENLPRAEQMLAAQPEIAGADLCVALLLGDVQKVEKSLRESPAMVREKIGPRQWEPLVYVCFSRFARRKSGRAADLTETASLLLRHGADPNAFCVNERWPDSPLSCLYAATGLNNNPALARVLLAAGARPDDGESLYHATEHADLECLRLLLAHGASLFSGNILKHMLDREDLAGVRLLLAAGADPNDLNHRGENALHWAVWRGRGVDIVAALLESGADIHARRKDGRSAYGLAVLSGQKETAALLEARGANTELSAGDRFIGACATAGPDDFLNRLAEARDISLGPEHARSLPDFASHHRTGAVRILLAAGVPVDTRGENGGTALHWACWKGYADLVKLLLEHGASPTIEDEAFHAPPPGWFMHGRENCGEGEGDYSEVERLLRQRGLLPKENA